MVSYTENYNLTKLGPSEGIHAGTDSFASADRDLLDQILYQLATHQHLGTTGATNAPDTALDLTLSTSGGTIPAGTTVSYVYTWVDPDTGETLASPEAQVTTAAALTAPAAPTAVVTTTGGTLEPGQYYYVASQYQTSTTVETKALYPVSVQIPAGTNTNQVDLTFAALEAGATGYNIYRRSPNNNKYFWIGNTTGTTFNDNGLDSDCDRSLPSENSTNGTNSVDISIPGATPTVPPGNDWRIYRTYTSSYSNSLLIQLTDASTTYTDVGNGTTAGTPPTIAILGSPSKIDLTDGNEVEGRLPMGLVDGFDQTISFTQSSPAEPVRTMDLDGTGDYATVVYEDRFDVLGDLDIRVHAAADDWTPAADQVLIAKRVSSLAWQLVLRTTGDLAFSFRSGSTDYFNAAVSDVLGATNGTDVRLRVTRAAASGTVTWYTSSDGVTWTQLGATDATTAGNLDPNNDAVYLGARGGAANPFDGTILAAEVRNGIDGAVVASFDADDGTLGQTGGSTVTTPLPAKFMHLDGTGDYASTPDAAAHQLTGNVDLRAHLAPDSWAPAANQRCIGTVFSPDGYGLHLRSDGNLGAAWGDGSALNFDTSTVAVTTVFSSGETGWVRATHDVSTGDTKFYTSTDGTTWTQLGATVANTAPGSLGVATGGLRVGHWPDGSSVMSGIVLSAEVRNGIDGPVVASFDAADFAHGDTSPDTAVDGQGNTWTLNGNATVSHETTWTLQGDAEIIPVNSQGLTGIVFPIEYPSFEIIGVRAYASTAPTGSDVIVDIQRNTGSGWTSIFTSLPTISVGTNSSGRVVPTTTTLNEADLLRMYVSQSDSNAAAVGLIVNVYGVAIHQSTTSGDYS